MTSQPAKKETQLYRLITALTDAGEAGLAKSAIVTKLGVKESSIPVYIHLLKKKYKAEIENQTTGRVVTGYVLKNTPPVPQFKRATTAGLKSVTSSPSSVQGGDVPILDSDVDEGVSVREAADILDSVGYTPDVGDVG